MKYTILSLVLVCGFFSKFSFGGEIFTECSTCTSSSKFENKAQFTAIQQGGTRNDVTVVNYYTSEHKNIEL